jgi:MFS transporter, FLVCR family, MFS-domain-containing protein 7
MKIIVRPHNTGPLYFLFALIGIISIALLPVALELGCEITRNADAAAAFLWFSANLFSVIFVLGEYRLRQLFSENTELMLVLSS